MWPRAREGGGGGKGGEGGATGGQEGAGQAPGDQVRRFSITTINYYYYYNVCVGTRRG